MPSEPNHRIRIKLPSGAEFEAEGSPEFISQEKRDFLIGLQEARTGASEAQSTAAATTPDLQNPQPPNIAWDNVIEQKGRIIKLRGKLGPGNADKEACLVLLAASQKLLNEPKPSAALLAKWLRSSGYPILRMDRILQEAITQGQILASGSRRSRCYELTGPGRVKAYVLAHQLSQTITGNY